MVDVEPFITGGLSACIASAVIHPIDLAKVRLQLFRILNPGVPLPKASTIITNIIKNEGPTAIYAGLSASLSRQAIYGTARIGLFRTFSNIWTEKNNGQISFAGRSLCSMAAAAVAVAIGTPFDVALIRMQADSMKDLKDRRGYKNVFDALSRVLREEGFGKLYSGLAPGILRGMSMNVGQMACFDQSKDILTSTFSLKKNATEATLGAAVIAGFTSSLFSLPFDLLKSRLQDGSRYKGLLDAAGAILKQEGPLAFWTGFSAYYMRTAPHAMMILLLTDPIRHGYKSIMNKEKK